MDITTLTIYVNDNETAAANVSQDQSPALFETFKAWREAKLRSRDESDKWDRVLQVAAEYLSETGDFMDADDDVEVSDVTWFTKQVDSCEGCGNPSHVKHAEGCPTWAPFVGR